MSVWEKISISHELFQITSSNAHSDDRFQVQYFEHASVLRPLFDVIFLLLLRISFNRLVTRRRVEIFH